MKATSSSTRACFNSEDVPERTLTLLSGHRETANLKVVAPTGNRPLGLGKNIRFALRFSEILVVSEIQGVIQCHQAYTIRPERPIVDVELLLCSAA